MHSACWARCGTARCPMPRPLRQFAWLHADCNRRGCVALVRMRSKHRPPRTAATRDRRKRTSVRLSRQGLSMLAAKQHATRPRADHAGVIPNVRAAERGTCCHGVAPSSGPSPGDARVRNYGFSGPAILGRRYRISRGISETFPSGAWLSIPCATPCLPMP